jgi:two-component system response regulator HydG
MCLSTSGDGHPFLLVDDEPAALRSYETHLSGEGITNVLTCGSADAALRLLEERSISVLLLDLRLPGRLGSSIEEQPSLSGRELLCQVAGRWPHIPVVVITGVDEVETAVGCMKDGALEYLVKPVDPNRLLTSLKKARELFELRRENSLLREGLISRDLRHPEAFADMVTADAGMQSLFRYAEAIAETRRPVLISGETGVGKELMARAIHSLSGRSGELVAVNPAGLDDSLFADTLFGHARGAFTGAERNRKGLVEQARDGTLFLDEIGDLSPASQVKLLRLVQEEEYFPLGADVPVKSSARLIVATNRDLRKLTGEETFRSDLYYRLLLHQIDIPPLRERRRDIPLLVNYFLSQSARELGRPAPPLPPGLLDLLENYDFPGNIRELRSLVFDALSRAQDGPLSADSFRKILGLSAHPPVSHRDNRSLAELYASVKELPTLREAEDLLIAAALERAGENQTLAAAMLGISRQTLHRRTRSPRNGKDG